MWKPEHRASADRQGLRYPSDLTDAEWALVAPLIRPAKRGGRPRTVNLREGSGPQDGGGHGPDRRVGVADRAPL